MSTGRPLICSPGVLRDHDTSLLTFLVHLVIIVLVDFISARTLFVYASGALWASENWVVGVRKQLLSAPMSDFVSMRALIIHALRGPHGCFGAVLRGCIEHFSYPVTNFRLTRVPVVSLHGASCSLRRFLGGPSRMAVCSCGRFLIDNEKSGCSPDTRRACVIDLLTVCL